jgi:hypothetical protein
LRWRGGQRGNWRIAECVAAERSCRDYADGRRGGVDVEARRRGGVDVEVWTWRCGRVGVGLDACGRRPLPQSLRLVRYADSGLGSRRWTVDRVLAALGDSARGRPRSTRLRSDSAKASSARGATLARRTGVRVPRRLRSRSLGIPVLAPGARTSGRWAVAVVWRSYYREFGAVPAYVFPHAPRPSAHAHSVPVPRQHLS